MLDVWSVSVNLHLIKPFFTHLSGSHTPVWVSGTLTQALCEYETTYLTACMDLHLHTYTLYTQSSRTVHTNSSGVRGRGGMGRGIRPIKRCLVSPPEG